MDSFKNIVIISGISGTIGNALFQEFVFDKDTLIFGISRRGIKNLKTLPHYTCIVDVNLEDKKDIANFSKKVFSLNPESISYIHCIGPFKTELDRVTLQRKIEIDDDGDGLDDEIYKNIFILAKNMAVGLISQRQNSPIHLSFVNIGSLVENYDISIFRSWTGVRRLVREEFKRLASDFKDISSIDIVVSSILSVTELIARPYVLGTDNDPRYWLKPQDLAKRVKAIILKRKDGFRQYKIFHKAPGVSHDRFKESEMVKRRLFEHYGLIKSEPRKKFK